MLVRVTRTRSSVSPRRTDDDLCGVDRRGDDLCNVDRTDDGLCDVDRRDEWAGTVFNFVVYELEMCV